MSAKPITEGERDQVFLLALLCGLQQVHHGWRVDKCKLHPVDRKTVEIIGYKSALAELEYAL